MECISLRISWSEKDVRLIKAFIFKIHNVPRSVAQFILSAGLTILLAAAYKSGPYMISLIIFSALLTLFFLYLLAYCLIKRPKLLRAATGGAGQAEEMIFHANDIAVVMADASKHMLSYKDIVGQYWYEDRYVIYVDGSGIQGLFPVAVNADSFDDILFLAQNLEQNKKKLYQIKQLR